jgi:hypothetical protein
MPIVSGIEANLCSRLHTSLCSLPSIV